MKRSLLLLFMLSCLFTGCWDRSQLEDNYYVIKLGLDRYDETRLLVSVQVAITPYLTSGVLGGGVQTDDPASACHTMTTLAGTVTQAIHMLNSSLTRSLSMKHLRAVIIGEELAREGVEPVMMELWRESTVRGTALTAQARGKTAQEVLTSCRSIGEVNLARVPEGYLLQHKRYHLAPPVRTHHFMTRMAAEGGDPYLPAVGINPLTEGTPGDLTGRQRSALPGEMPRLGGNPVEFLGTAVFRKDRLAGFLNVDETQMMLALRGEMGKAYVTFPDPDWPEKRITMRFQQENLPKYQATMLGGKPHIRIRLLFEGELLAAPGGTDWVPPENRVRLEEAASREAEDRIKELVSRLRQWRADPVGFGHLYRSQFARRDQWEQFRWRERLDRKELAVDCSVQMRIRRYGLYTGPDATRGGKER